MKYDIYICYCKQDKVTANYVREIIESAGYFCCAYEDYIMSGDVIENCSLFIYIHSIFSLQSARSLSEIAKADALGKNILTINIDGSHYAALSQCLKEKKSIAFDIIPCFEKLLLDTIGDIYSKARTEHESKRLQEKCIIEEDGEMRCIKKYCCCIDQVNAASRKAEKQYNDALQEAEKYEKKGDYSSMIDMLNIALTVKPESTEAKQMLDEANRKLSEIKVKNEQYNKIIRIAQDAFKEDRWQDAYTKSESALELFPDSAEAKRINTDSLKKIKFAETLKDLLLRADIFIGQKLYAEAKEELNKAKIVDANNKEIKSRIEKIDSILNKQKKDIEELEKKISETKEKKDYDDAIKYCKELLNIDYANQRKWNEEIINLQAIRKKEKEDAELFNNLKKQIDEADYNDQYKIVVNLCKQALSIKDDESLRKRLSKAETKHKLLIEQKEFNDLVTKIKSLIADKSWEEAHELTKDLQNNYPEYNDVVKQLFKTIFDAQENWNDKKEESTSSKRQPIGFKPPKETGPIKTDDWDWDSPKKQNIQKIEKSAAFEKKPQPKKSNDDFFDKNYKTDKSKKSAVDEWDWDLPEKSNVQKTDKSAASERKPQPKKSNDDFFDMNFVADKLDAKKIEKSISIERKIQSRKLHNVYSSIFAPAEVKRKSHLQVQVYLHLSEETETVKSLAKESDKNAERRDYIPLSLKLRKGDKVDVEFNVYGETRLMSDRKSIVWQGSFTKCSFDYFVPEDIDVDELSCVTLLSVNGVPLGEMRFITQIVDIPRQLNPEIMAHKYNKVFISYSHKDESKVKFLHEGLELGSVPHFFDRTYLKVGDVFPQKIQDYIDSADLFILCWSQNASESDYVQKERLQAIERAFPKVQPESAAKLRIYPLSIEPRAEMPSDMKDVYNFGVI